ncbi:hypothetical protein J2T55_001382 [Methylohalomonas lacus]|uniref:Uncharacterized protein n=1 Tax=Methylohalomonas lacus TaxID=398773 RepID=A0AAE3HLK6_9GAMM|nr:hypothetical protein [Methylohalomonas lacus]MCS3903361.1 hypothetical protein [Methylohalomonas lacus]
MKRHALLFAALILLLTGIMPTTSTDSQARTFREFRQIPKPEGLPDNAERVETIEPVDRELVERGVREILGAWNSGQLESLLAEAFVNRQKLADTLITVVPRDAELDLLSLRSFSTLEQYNTAVSQKGRYRVSKVSAVIRMQVIFNDPQTGYQRLPNTSEFIIEIREPI